MGATGRRARSELRTGWRGWLAVALVIAIGGGVAIASAAAARRTDTALDRALREGRAADAFVTVDATSQGAAQARRIADQIERDPSVLAAGRIAAIDLEEVRDGHVNARLQQNTATGLVSEGTTVGRTISRMTIEHGRPADPSSAEEVVINPQAAAVTGWRVGQRLTHVKLYRDPDYDAQGNPLPNRGQAVQFRVVGIGHRPEDLLSPPADRVNRIFLTPAFGRAHPDAGFYFADVVRLRNGRHDVARFRAAANRIAGPHGPFVGIVATAEGADEAHHGNRPLVIGLWAVAALTGAMTLVLAAQSFSRQYQSNVADDAILRAVGLTRGDRFAARLLASAPAIVAGTLLALALAVAVSPIAPLGPLREAEPRPGVHADVPMLLAGALALAVAVLVVALRPAWISARTAVVPSATGTPTAERPSRIVDAVTRSALPVTAAIGTRLALQRTRRPGALSTPGMLASLTLAAAVAAGVLTFGHDLTRLTTKPDLYGWSWHAAVGTDFGRVPDDALEPLRTAPHVVAAAGMVIGDLRIAGRTVPAVGIDPLSGTLTPRIDQGRAPSGPGEVALGVSTMRQVHARLGDSVIAKNGSKALRLRVVGIATFPAFGTVRYHETGLGTGALTTAGVLTGGVGADEGTYNYVLLRFSSADPTADVAALRTLVAKAGCATDDCVITDSRPNDLRGYASARNLAALVAALVALLVLSTLAHAAITTGRARASELAVLQALGFLRRQTAAAMRWQVAVLTGLALLVGIPLGIAIAHWTWLALTHGLGIATPSAIPAGVLALGAVAIVAAGLLIATVAARIPRPSLVMR